MIELQNIGKFYKDFQLRDINIKVETGEYYVLLGKSGAGKSIILEMIAGLISPEKGKIIHNNVDITNLRIQKRNIGIVFQDYSVFPHMTVRQNIEYPLISTKVSKDVREQIICELSEKVGITKLLQRKPATLSGGELQRVAIARTLALKPDCLLLDEPLSSLDIQLCNDIRKLLRKLNNEGLTIIHVTHDYEEAAILADRIGVIQNGEIIQQGKAQQVFNNPKSKFVAHLTGIKNFYRVAKQDNNRLLAEEKFLVPELPGMLPEKGFIIISNEQSLIFRGDGPDVTKCIGVVREIIPTKTGFEIIVNIGIEVSIIMSKKAYSQWNNNIDDEINIYLKSSDIKVISDEK